MHSSVTVTTEPIRATDESDGLVVLPVKFQANHLNIGNCAVLSPCHGERLAEFSIIIHD